MCSKGAQFEEKLDLWTCSERPTMEYKAGEKCVCVCKKCKGHSSMHTPKNALGKQAELFMFVI